MSTAWGFEDRRGMFQGGKEVHEPSKRRPSGTSGSVTEAVRKASITASETVQKVTSNTSNTAGEAPRRRVCVQVRQSFADIP